MERSSTPHQKLPTLEQCSLSAVHRDLCYVLYKNSWCSIVLLPVVFIVVIIIVVIIIVISIIIIIIITHSSQVCQSTCKLTAVHTLREENDVSFTEVRL